MLVYKCDICKKEIRKENEMISVDAGGLFRRYFLCGRCGKPVINFLDKNKLTQKPKSKK